MPAPPELLSYIDASAPAFIARLSEGVAIPSIRQPAFRPHVLAMSHWIAAQLRAVGVTVKQVDLGTQLMDAKKTVLVYGHFDVRPAAKSDGTPSPRSTRNSTTVSRTWLNTRTPALIYGLKGLVYLKLTVSGPGRDLHYGVFGRTVYEPITDLISLLSRLVDPAGNILVPGVDDTVPAVAVEERLIMVLSTWRARRRGRLLRVGWRSVIRATVCALLGGDGCTSRGVKHRGIVDKPVVRHAQNEVVIENERLVMLFVRKTATETTEAHDLHWAALSAYPCRCLPIILRAVLVSYK
ncbi:hypothetical protein B0H13DRAFT_2375126 [Mycena leptocephala]|nr:hypothetical protein B0H13DRAFT_2375126 [Mycena leptocephala]